MGRSVGVLADAEYNFYFTVEEPDDDPWFTEEFTQNLCEIIQSKFKSYYMVNEWVGESVLKLENYLCQIGFSKYYHLWSCSIRINPDVWNYETPVENLAGHHAQQIKDKLFNCLQEAGCTMLRKLGNFSNGEGVYKLIEKNGN